MPTDGDPPGDKTSKDEAALDPLSQPPLVRPPPRPLTGASHAEDADSPAAGGDDDAADGGKPDNGDERSSGAAPPKARGRLLGFLGFLFGLAGLAAAGYLYYSLIYLDTDAQVDARFARLEAEIAGSERALAELAKIRERALADFAAEQARAADEAGERLLEAVNRVAAQAPPSRREWKVAELAYLLRIANHRILMERDVEGALTLLKAADAMLQELDDFALYQVRAQVADEILSLESVASNDVQGLFLRLEAVKTEISAQSVKLPRFEQVTEAAADDAGGFWSALRQQLGSYFRFRRFDGDGVQPLLAPEEAVYLELNLRLMLERAQLAALRREQVIYQQSLQTAADWMASYLDADNPGVARSLEELESLSSVELERPLPDISGSLTTLKQLGEA